jgi:molecular chaperone IbpA
MRTYDFTPFARSAIGFDRLFDLLKAGTGEAVDHFPPYDIVRTGGENFRISLAVAGFTPGDIAITAQQNLLTIVGRKAAEKEGADYLYKGISAKAFEQRFNLADHVEVESASFDNGLLQIDLVQRIPEAMKPRRIEVRAPSGAPSAVGPKAA